MGFSRHDRPTKQQASMSSFTQSLKDDVGNVGELVKGTGRAIGNAVKEVGHAVGIDGRNKDLKTRMKGHSGFRERTRNDD